MKWGEVEIWTTHLGDSASPNKYITSKIHTLANMFPSPGALQVFLERKERKCSVVFLCQMPVEKSLLRPISLRTRLLCLSDILSMYANLPLCVQNSGEAKMWKVTGSEIIAIILIVWFVIDNGESQPYSLSHNAVLFACRISFPLLWVGHVVKISGG